MAKDFEAINIDRQPLYYIRRIRAFVRVALGIDVSIGRSSSCIITILYMIARCYSRSLAIGLARDCRFRESSHELESRL